MESDGNGEVRDNTVRYKIINDPIHGQMELNIELFSIIDTPIFQRLRDLKQLGGMYLVFPGASHHRFEHCLGTCYLAGKWMRHFQRLNCSTHRITQRDIFLVEVAGLCHDLGHGPFSHAFEREFTDKLGLEFDHEQISCELLQLINNDVNVLTPKELECVKKMIKGDARDIPRTQLFMYQIVHNKRNSVDVDKFDYIARDCYSASLPLGFNYERTMMLSRVDRDGSIVFNVKEAMNLFTMFFTRYSLHKQMYQHIAGKSIELMIGEILRHEKVIEHFHLDDIVRERRWAEYAYMTDSIFNEIVRRFHNDIPQIERLQRRDLYKYVCDLGPVTAETAAEIYDLLTESDINEDIAVCRYTYDMANKNRNPFESTLRFYPSDGEPASVLPKGYLTNFMPPTAEERYIRVYARGSSIDEIKKAVKGFINDSPFQHVTCSLTPKCDEKSKTRGRHSADGPYLTPNPSATKRARAAELFPGSQPSSQTSSQQDNNNNNNNNAAYSDCDSPASSQESVVRSFSTP